MGPKPTLYHISVQLTTVENFKVSYTHFILHQCPNNPHYSAGLEWVLKPYLLFNYFSTATPHPGTTEFVVLNNPHKALLLVRANLSPQTLVV